MIIWEITVIYKLIFFILLYMCQTLTHSIEKQNKPDFLEIKCFIDYCYSHQKVTTYGIVQHVVYKFLKITLLQALGDKPWFWHITFLPESKECYPNGVKQYLLLWEERLFSWKKILTLSWNIPFSDKCDLYSNLKNFLSSIFKVKKSQTLKCDE